MALGAPFLPHVRAIFWAQIRTLRNFYPRGNLSRTVATWALAALWYGLWTFGAVSAGIVLADVDDMKRLELLLSHGLMAVMLYWQLIPVLMVSAGASLDLNRLRIYPIPNAQLFGIEVMLRTTNAVEMLLILGGATAGLLANPALSWSAPAGFVPFVLMNLFIAAGLRQLLTRLLARKHVREIAFLLLVTMAALPQVLLIFGVPAPVKQYVATPPEPWWPWSAGAAVTLNPWSLQPWLALTGWTLIAFAFGRWQFERSLRFDSRAADTRTASPRPILSLAERLFRLPGAVFPDPLGAAVEKELRTLIRSPRFRVVFIMGFTFGLIIWLPITIRGSEATGFFIENYLTFVSLYALLLLGEVTFWNSFGFDRGAARLYYLLDAPAASILVAKNIAALIFVLLELSAVALACRLLGMPVTGPKLIEAYAVTLVLAIYMLTAGNLGSAFYPRPVDPRQSWRTSSAGRLQAMLLFLYPVIALPVILAFVARWAMASEWAFWGVLGFAVLLGAAAYRIALDSAAGVLVNRREQFLAALSATEGPVAN